jgi:iron complex outermembrane receptor protein
MAKSLLNLTPFILLLHVLPSLAAQSPPSGEAALFDQLPVVEAAALHAQTLEEAPANVTIISAADIRKYGYRTLGEALAGVRGFDLTYDRIYRYVGVHGFSLPGDYNTRFLVMINGHPMTENVFSSNNFFGQDFGLDMDLIQRIEIVRGPSSALYGSNGIFATINIVTISPVDQPRARVVAETGSFGEKKTTASIAANLGKGANLVVSASVFNNAGQALYVPQFDAPDTNNGITNLDGERGYHTFANLVWHNWNLVAYFNSREKAPPVNWESSALFDHRGTRVQDRRNFVSLSRTAAAGVNGKLVMRLSYDQYRYDDRFFYPLANDIQDVRNIAHGDWITANVTYSVPVTAVGQLTAGLEGTLELQSLQHNYAAHPDYENQLRISRPDRSFALFVQQEWNISNHWSTTMGVRLDDTQNFGHSISPRVALVHRKSDKTVYKFVYGHPFRNPSAFEQYYADNYSYLASGGLRPEAAHTFEFSVEHKLRPELTAIANVYHYRINDIIQTVYLPDGLQQFQNVATAQSKGAEFELTGKLSNRVETTASVALQDTDGQGGNPLANSALVIAKGRVAVPVVLNRLYLSSSVQYLSPRLTHVGESVRPVALVDLTGTWDVGRAGWRVQFGVRNLLNYAYYDPVAIAVDKLREDGRSVFLKLSWKFGG